MSSAKVILVTGANTGLGLETVKCLLKSTKSYHILLGSRSAEKGETAILKLKAECPAVSNTVEYLQLDVDSDDSIKNAFNFVTQKHGRLDHLVNNAGQALELQILKEGLDERQALNAMYNTNVTSAHMVTRTFAPLLVASGDPRLLFITSGTSHLERFSREHWPGPVLPAGWPKPPFPTPVGYRASKTALNMVMLSWHWILREDGVKTWCISPGMLVTGLGGASEMAKKMGAGDPRDGGELVLRVLEGENDADCGKIVSQTGIQSW